VREYVDIIVLAGSVSSRVDVYTRVNVPAGKEIVIVYANEVVIVDAGTIDVSVICKIVVCVSRGSVTGYELIIVEAGWIEVSTRVRVC
jgi:hypothetical protein